MLNSTRPASVEVGETQTQTSYTETLEQHISMMKEVEEKIKEIEVSHDTAF